MAKTLYYLQDHNSIAAIKAYYRLCKPNVVALMLLTAIVGMLLATPGWLPWADLVFATAGIGLAACAGAAFNHILDRPYDKLMGRTKHRPLPTGKISLHNALIFAIVLALLGMVLLITFINALTAILTLLTLVGYAGIYTVFLKHRTPQNIVIGGAAGAAPPLLGWTAVTGHIDPNSLLLVLIIFTWTPPHFWALAIHRHKEYQKVNIPMLPVTHGIPFTKLYVLLYTSLLFAVSLLPFVTQMSGLIYLVGAIILGAGFIYYSVLLMFTQKKSIAMKTFRYSIFYLMSLFIILLIDHYMYL